MRLYHPRRHGSIDFSSVFNAPGARGFFGEGYPFHTVWKLVGITWKDTGFVAKTMTLLPKEGNMPFKPDRVTPREIFPRCIDVEPLSGHVLNAVGLSNAGSDWLFGTQRWQQITQPFFLSFMAIAVTKSDRLEEWNRFVQKNKLSFQRDMKGPVALQLNFACPNVGMHSEDLQLEVIEVLEITARLGIPLVPNFNPLVPVNVLYEASRHPACSGFWIANTVPWGAPGIDWESIFKSDVSPLYRKGFAQSGGLSGPACLPLVIRKVGEARNAGITQPIIAGNGIQAPEDVQRLKKAGADGIAIGSVAIVRPWRMKSIIQTAHAYFS